MSRNTLEIQQYEEQIAVLEAKVRRLEVADRASAAPSLYICTRCGLLYQSPWGCGCPATSPARISAQRNARER